ncbi:hypothetical protein ZWY2020_053296 [Hordeum vulgare]|nr:hypothetical protein ZWY2020_053296 [Hordeum vulgare]
MHRIFRNTLFPYSGNFDEVHGSLAEMLLLCEEAMSQESAQLDISDVMFTELWNCIIMRKVPIYGPYLFAYIRHKWQEAFPEELLYAQFDYIVHDPIRLRVKDKWANPSTSSQHMDTDTKTAADRGTASQSRSSAMPSWAIKLQDKMKTLFYMQAKGQYQTHVAQKQSRQRHKRVLRTLDVDISSGSEDDITPEATWMQAQGYQWSGDEAEEEEQTNQEGTNESGDAEDEE